MMMLLDDSIRLQSSQKEPEPSLSDKRVFSTSIKTLRSPLAFLFFLMMDDRPSASNVTPPTLRLVSYLDDDRSWKAGMCSYGRIVGFGTLGHW